MGRRSPRESVESAFGSDSFLDVVANIVGILIILIVIVGVRIKHTPPATAEQDRQKTEQMQAAWQAEREAIEKANRENEESYRKSLAERDEELARQQKARASYETALSAREEQVQLHEDERKRREKILAQYEEEARGLRQEMERLSRQLQIAQANSLAQKKEATDRWARLDLQIKEAAEQKTQLLGQIGSSQKQWDESTRTGAELAEQIAELKRKLAEVTQTMPATRPLKHYATPMARSVRKQHVFFYCKGGRMAYAYFDELLEMARDQARGRMTPSSSRIEGVVGPVGSFRLRYVYTRTGVSVTEMLSGPMSVAYSIGQIILKPDVEPIGERIDEVLEPNSSFRVKLRSLAADKHAVTLWVYGDSFELSKQVEEFLHDQGFDVVLMPLPDGQPVSLGPNGFTMDAR